MLSNQIYAKYNYQFILDAFSLNRDTTDIAYKIEKSISDNTYTNKDVILKIIANKPIGEIEGFKLDDSRMTLTKTISQNENKTILLEDLSGNKKEINYNINNIDKEPPKIIGVEDGKTYNKAMKVTYTDNVEVKDIDVERYSDKLVLRCIDEYYSSAYYEGLDTLGNHVFIDIVEHPKEAIYYTFYLDGKFRAYTERTDYTFQDLSNGTTYTVKVNAYNSKDEIIATATETVTTRCFRRLYTTKTEDTFNVEITKLNNEVSLGKCAVWYEGCGTKISINPTINSDRTVNFSFNAYQIDGKKSSEYYYIELPFISSTNKNLNQVLRMNIKFDENYAGDAQYIDQNNLDKNGEYEITVTDVAGNQTTKNCTIKI